MIIVKLDLIRATTDKYLKEMQIQDKLIIIWTIHVMDMFQPVASYMTHSTPNKTEVCCKTNVITLNIKIIRNIKDRIKIVSILLQAERQENTNNFLMMINMKDKETFINALNVINTLFMWVTTNYAETKVVQVISKNKEMLVNLVLELKNIAPNATIF